MLNASRVSVVVCSKNSSSMLKSCLDSIINNQPGEIIFIDGNSIDDSLEIVSTYSDVKIYSDQGLGLSSARKLGVYHSTKEYVLFIGPDNILESSFINDLVAQINSSPYEDGWIACIEFNGTIDEVKTLSSQEYLKFIGK